jgi:hypothetical protein
MGEEFLAARKWSDCIYSAYAARYMQLKLYYCSKEFNAIHNTA